MSSKPVLKLAFAMGGGVSLGTFSGAALTEAIKLALLRKAEGTAEYDEIEVDVFSGASAGSLALAVMLRALTWRYADEEAAARESLTKQLGSRFWRGLDAELQKDLVAVQVAQDLQNAAWVEQINMDELLGGKDPARMAALRIAPSLLDSEAVYQIARRLLMPREGADEVPNLDKRLLPRRCLYGCTLTSLTPFVQDATGSFNTSPGSAPGLRDALRTQMHKDMRIFDINFERLEPQRVKSALAIEKSLNKGFQKVAKMRASTDADKEQQLSDVLKAEFAKQSGPEYFGRWFRLHQGPSQPLLAGNLWKTKSWARIAATAIASGAFPLAFQPAVIERYLWEYGDEWPEKLKEMGGHGEPADRHPFAYVDGGVFNNDPIREAFRMASFMDARDPRPEKIRRLIYVDPAVAAAERSMNVGVLREQAEDKANPWNLASPQGSMARSSLSRVFTMFGGVIGTLVDQGRAREADGQAKTRNNFETRERFRSTVGKLVGYIDCEDFAANLHNDLIIGCAYCLHQLYLERIPPGDGSLLGELQRVMREMGGLIDIKLEDAGSYLEQGFKAPKILLKKAQWLWVHLSLYFDLLLGLEGKNANTEIIAITPYTDNAAKTDIEELKLMGDSLAAFTGFMSKPARVHDFDAGKHSAAVFLRLDALPHSARKSPVVSLIPEHRQWHALRPHQPDKVQYTKDLIVGLNQIRRRLETMIKDGLGTVARLGVPVVEFLNNVNKIIRDNVDDVVKERFAKPGETYQHRVAVEIMILLPVGLMLKLDATGPLDHDGKPVPITRPGGWKNTPNALFTGAHYDFEKQRWEGAAVHGGSHLKLEPTGMHLHAWGSIALPSPEKLKAMLITGSNHLRPVLKFELNAERIKLRGSLAAASTSDAIWESCELAIPLMEKLMFPNFKDFEPI